MSAATTPPIDPAPGSGRDDGRLHRLRWAVRGVLTLGVGASIAANVLHAHPDVVSRAIAAWPPLALMLTVELISRMPVRRGGLAMVRVLATAAIALIAAWLSYWHMADVAARHGEDYHAAAYLLPLSVDGLVVVASINLLEISARLRGTAPQRPAGAGTGPETPPGPAATPTAATNEKSATPPGPAPRTPPPPPHASPPAGTPEAATPASGRAEPSSADAGSRPMPDQPGVRDDESSPDAAAGQPHRRDTAAAVAYWRQKAPGMHPAEIARRIGRSERTVRRYWPHPTGHDNHLTARQART